MKKGIIGIFASIIILFNSCDKIDGPYAASGGPIDTVSQDSAVRRVLLEEYTGHTCVACPLAHSEALRLQNQYGDRIVVLSIHSGDFAKPKVTPNNSFNYDFRTTTGNDISIASNILGSTGNTLEAFPKGIINRSPNSAGFSILDWSNWEVAINDQLALPVEASLKISNSFNVSDSTITSTVDIKAISKLVDPVSICMYVVEDSIVNWQKNGNVDVQFYTHRHVLRGSLNGSFGQSQGAMTAGQTKTKTFSAKLMRSDANPNQVYIYAVLVNDITKEVIQVEEKKLLN